MPAYTFYNGDPGTRPVNLRGRCQSGAGRGGRTLTCGCSETGRPGGGSRAASPSSPAIAPVAPGG